MIVSELPDFKPFQRHRLFALKIFKFKLIHLIDFYLFRVFTMHPSQKSLSATTAPGWCPEM